MYALFDTSRNFTVLNDKLAKQLCLNVEAYTSNFQVASSVNVCTVKWLPKRSLQFHNSLAVMVKGIRMINRAAN